MSEFTKRRISKPLHELTNKLLWFCEANTKVEGQMDRIIREWLEEKAQEYTSGVVVLERIDELLGLTPDPVDELADKLKERYHAEGRCMPTWEQLAKEALNWAKENKNKL